MVLGPNDEPHRFCQKCHLVHLVSAFAGSSHICVAKLAQLKERRAARRGVPPAAAAPAAGGSRDEQVFLFGEAPNWQESLLQTQQAVPDASSAAMVALLLASPPLVAPAPPSASPSALALHTLQRAESPTGWPVSLPECLSVEVKLPAGGSPAAVLPASGMRDELLSALSLTLVGDASTSQPASAALFMGAVRPGCTLLTLDASLLSPPAADGVLSSASRVACALYRAVPSLFAKQPRDGVRVVLRSSAGAGNCAHLRLRGNEPVDVVSPSLSPSPRTLKVRPLAVLSTADTEVLLSGGGSLSDCAVHVRLNGQSLRVGDCAPDGDGALRFTVPAVGVDGCACLDVEPRAASPDALHAPLRHLLLCTNAAIVEEVAASAKAADALPCGPRADAQHAGLQRAVWALGCALSARGVQHVAARTPRGRQRCLVALGAAAAIQLGWLAALDSCLTFLADVDERDTAVIGGSGGATLLHQAVHAGAGPLLDRVLAASPSVRGCASAPDAHGVTPVHLAARAGCGATLEALCCMAGSAERKADAASAVVAFSCAHDDEGATPAKLVMDAAQRLPSAEATLLQACIGRLLDRAAAGAAAVNAAAAAVSGSRLGASSVMHLFDLVDAQLAEPACDPDALDAQLIGTSLLRQLDGALAVHDRVDVSAVASVSVAAPAEAASADLAEDELTGSTDVRVISLMFSAILMALQYIICVVSRLELKLLPDETIRSYLPAAPWYVWLRMPTSMCGTGHRGGVFIVRCVVTLYALAVALVAAAQGRSDANRARLFPCRVKPSHLASTQLILLAFVWVLDPIICSVRTNLRYAGAGHLRQPWQGGLRQLIPVLTLHAASATRLPPAPYSALLLARGILPLLVRAAETGPAVLAPLVSMRLLSDRFAWDVAHLAVTAMCVAHTVHARTLNAGLVGARHASCATVRSKLGLRLKDE